MIVYLIKACFFQFLLLGFYEVALKRETFFQWNRFYLLVSPILGLLLPFVAVPENQLQWFGTYSVSLPEVLIGGEEAMSLGVSISSTELIVGIWLFGLFIALGFLLYKLAALTRLLRTNTVTKRSGYSVVTLSNSKQAFSFLQFIFLGDRLEPKQKELILQHEMVHVRQRHSIDLLFFELLKLVLWFNPCTYVFQRKQAQLLEYIADAEVVKARGAANYYQQLLAQLFQTTSISFVNTFYKHSLIKNRISMLQKKQNNPMAQLKFLALVPILAMAIIFVSCADPKEDSTAEATDLEMTTSPDTDKKPLAFSDLDNTPVFPGCEGLSETENKQCFTQKVAQYVVDNFDTDVVKGQDVGEQRIIVQFIVDASGRIADIKSHSEIPELQEEALRVAESLPNMQPGTKEGEPVAVQFALPIKFVF